eukprot:scaffold2731_cov59-Phaeocystis_antarctica.AAC.1
MAFGRRDCDRHHTAPATCRAARALTRCACPCQALKRNGLDLTRILMLLAPLVAAAPCPGPHETA